MDKQQSQRCRVKSIFFYLRESFRFHDVDKPVVAQIVFILILAIFLAVMSLHDHIPRMYFYTMSK